MAEQSEKMSLGIGRRPYSNGSRRVRRRSRSFGGGVAGGASVSSAMFVRNVGERKSAVIEFRNQIFGNEIYEARARQGVRSGAKMGRLEMAK